MLSAMAGTKSALLERQAEQIALDDTLAMALAGTGAGVVLEGEAGIGKTSLLETAMSGAGDAGLRTLRARGGELERGLTFGVARQLVEALVARADDLERERLLAGAAGPAAGLLGAARPPDPLPDEPSLVHALYWLIANLADDGPLCLVVDDAQWSDTASLRWLVYLARRLDELPIALLIAVRVGEPDAPVDLLEALATQAGVRRLRPRALSSDATAELVRGAYDREPAPEFCDAVQEATGGNPFLVREVLTSLLAENAAPGAAEARRIAQLQPRAVASSVLLRLGRLPTAAVALARAVSVLGTKASLARAAALAGLDPEEAAEAADVLAAARVLKPELPLEFNHPVIRTILYQDIPAGERSRAHARAARLMRAEGCPAAEVVVHLLATEPAGDAEVVGSLRDAVAAEPDQRRAVALLRRALAEPPPPAQRARVLLELGEVEARAYQPEAIEHLTEARESTDDADLERQAARALARAWTLDPRPDAALAWAEAELARKPEGDVEHALHALNVVRGSVSAERARVLRDRAAAASTVAERYLLAALAYKSVEYGTASDAAELAEAALRGGLEAEGVRGSGFVLTFAALEFADSLERAAELAQKATDDARARGDLSGFALGLTLRADVEVRAGDLDHAVDDAQDALQLAAEHGLAWAEPVSIGTLLEALAEQGRHEEAEVLLTERVLSEWQQGSARAATFMHARARLRLAQSRPEQALEDYRATGEILQRYAIDHPAGVMWRCGAALALLALDRRDEAAGLVDQELAMARSYGSPHPIGNALRVAGLIAGGEQGRALLEEAVETLKASQAKLVYAQALVDLGAALRRSNERSAAREHLRLGLDLAHRCCASSLEERAMQELEASGARPRRRVISGLDALTPSERRVAEMAARGMTNRDIAQTLFLSVRTIENQLRQVYLKLDIGSRRDLPQALDASL